MPSTYPHCPPSSPSSTSTQGDEDAVTQGCVKEGETRRQQETPLSSTAYAPTSWPPASMVCANTSFSSFIKWQISHVLMLQQVSMIATTLLLSLLLLINYDQVNAQNCVLREGEYLYDLSPLTITRYHSLYYPTCSFVSCYSYTSNHVNS